jgi:hypothetical protein
MDEFSEQKLGAFFGYGSAGFPLQALPLTAAKPRVAFA